MSWNWCAREEQEKREYPVTGTVTISTEEYRDLIEEKELLWQKGQAEHDSWWDEYRKRECAETKAKKLQEKVNDFEAFLLAEPAVKEEYDNFCFRKLKEKADE